LSYQHQTWYTYTL